MKKCYIIVAVALWFIATLTSARIIEANWIGDSQEITKRSDVIVIGKFIQSRICGAPTNRIVSELSEFSYKTLAPEFVPVKTDFQISSILKGNLSTNHISLYHYNINPNSQTEILTDFPDLLCFTNIPNFKYPLQTTSIMPYPTYLLFLTKRSDGSYRPTTGQIDAENSAYSITPKEQLDRLVEKHYELNKPARQREAERKKKEAKILKDLQRYKKINEEFERK